MSDYDVTSVLSSLSSTSSDTTETESTDDDDNTLGQEAFLELLVTELQYQNPLDPMDGTEYVSQLAELTSLEELQNIDDNMETMSDTMDTMTEYLAYQVAYLQNLNENMSQSLEYQGLYEGSSLIGKTVEVNDGEVTGEVTKVSFEDGDTYVYIDGEQYSVDDITTVYEEA